MKSKPKISLNLVLGSLLFVTTIMMVASFQLLQDENVAYDKMETKLNRIIEERDETIKSLLVDTTLGNEWETASNENSLAPVEEFEEVEVCAYSPKKLWMDYRMITDESSSQYWYIQEHMSVQDNGLLLSADGYIGVALGSVYGEIGNKYTVTTNTGNIFKIVKIDEKADRHTTNGCYDSSGSMLEMVVDTNLMDENAKFHGDYDVVSEFNGTIIKILKEK